MERLSPGDIGKIVYGYIGVDGGYLGDFSYASHYQFYPVFCDLDIDPYEYEGTTRQRFEEILKSLSASEQAKMIRGVVERFQVGVAGAPNTRTERLRDDILATATRLEGVQVTGSIQYAGRESVIRAINDVESLLRSTGAVSAVDRIHTAIQGYLLSACEAEHIPYTFDSTTTTLLKLLRKQHRKLADLGPRTGDIDRILNSCGNILDAMTPLRNRASVAHPNETLLKEAEARLVINVGRTLLVYLDDKLCGTPDPIAEPDPLSSRVGPIITMTTHSNRARLILWF